MRKLSMNRRTLQQFWRFTKPDSKRFWIGSIIGPAIAVLVQDVFPPLILSKTFNKLQALYSSGAPLHINQFKGFIYAYIVFLLLGFIFWRLQVVLVWQYETFSQQRMVEYIFDHLQRQGTRFHANRFGGALVSQVNKFLGAYERFMDELTWSIVTDVVVFVSSLIILITVSKLYAAVLSVASIIYLLIMWRLMKKQAPYDRRQSQEESKRTAKLADNITNVASVRAFANEDYENALFHEQTTITRNASLSLMKRVFINDVVSHSMTMTISTLAFVLGIIAITNFGAPAGTLFLAVTYTMGIARRLWESGRVMRNINRSFGDAADMTEILDLAPEIQDPKQPEASRIRRGEVVFRNVDFSYSASKNDMLFRNLSFKIKPGEKVGLVGHSGGGKTTITQLLLRFMDVVDGSISIDGQDIRHIALRDLRSKIAYVAQEPMLFHRTLLDNIAYGQQDASDAQIRAVARMAHAHDFIEKLPEGYKTLVGERGVKLSGGQRQRVAIARAMLKNAPILVLDEATSALDSESENLIQEALWKLMEGRTAIVIAHRLSTIQKMDRILVMSEGKIVEQGSHKELIGLGGIYADLWNHQSGGFMED